MRYIEDIFGIVGTGLIGYGAWQIYEPACPLVVGAICMAAALIGAVR